MSLSRRQFLAAALAPATPKPNILFILADDLGHADLSCYGRRDYQTPNIDRLAAQGIRFTQAYANACVCSPTRTALITGRYQQRLPVGLEEPLATSRRQVSPGLPPTHPTLPSLLRTAGYRTALIGKWHLGWPPANVPRKFGYDSFYGFHAGGVDYFRHQKDLYENESLVNQTGYLTDLLADKAIAYLEQKSPQPFFLSLHFNAPHWPWEGPGDEAATRNLKSIVHFDGGSNEIYAAMVRRLDHQIGRILRAVPGNTIVIFTSDNGGERFSDNYPFTGRKSQLLEGGLRVPAIVRWPGHIPAGKTTAQVAITMDWFPTLLHLAQTAPHPDYPSDGINLTPHLTTNIPNQPRTLFWRHRHRAQRALRSGDMKWLKIGENSFLFDLKTDPGERANLKSAQPTLHAQLESQYEAWAKTMLPEDPNAYTYGFTPAELPEI